MHSAKPGGDVQVQILSEKLNLDVKIERVSWEWQWASPSTGAGRADGTASEWTGLCGGGFAPPRLPPSHWRTVAGGRRSRAGGLSCEITATFKYNVVVHNNNVVGHSATML